MYRNLVVVGGGGWRVRLKEIEIRTPLLSVPGDLGPRDRVRLCRPPNSKKPITELGS